MQTLDSIDVGNTVRVKNLKNDNPSLRRRLLDMGITPDAKITYVRSAPLGDPMELRVRGYSLTIRKSDASYVECEVL